MRTTRILTPLAVVALAAGAAVAVPMAASADTPSPSSSPHAPASLSDVQTRATAAAGRPVDALTDDRAKALAILNDDLTGIRTLESDISSATTVKQVRADERTAAASYRVREVALPEVRWAARIDAVTTTVLPRLQADLTKLTAALAKHADKSTSALTDALNDLGTQISTAQSDANGVAASALALSPATVAADDQALPRVRAQVKTVEDAVHQANQDAKTVRTVLR